MPSFDPEHREHTVPVDRVCFFCDDFTMKMREPDDPEWGAAFCRHHQKWFPEQDKRPAWNRTCKNWR